MYSPAREAVQYYSRAAGGGLSPGFQNLGGVALVLYLVFISILFFKIRFMRACCISAVGKIHDTAHYPKCASEKHLVPSTFELDS